MYYVMTATKDFELVYPATELIGVNMAGDRIVLGMARELRFPRRKGDRMTVDTKARALELIATGNWETTFTSKSKRDCDAYAAA